MTVPPVPFVTLAEVQEEAIRERDNAALAWYLTPIWRWRLRRRRWIYLRVAQARADALRSVR